MAQTKGIILAGGSGSRLHPITKGISKQLLPIYDKPMIYYPLSVLMLAKIQDILLISTTYDLPLFQKLLGDGSHLGMNITYCAQPSPDGIAQAFILGKDFINQSNSALILGDNIFFGENFSARLEEAKKMSGATIFGYHVPDPERFGVISLDENNKPLSIIEKPSNPLSNFAVTGLYFYDNSVVEIASQLKPSNRGELEITDINNEYLNRSKLNVSLLEQGFMWSDAGTHDSLLDTSCLIKSYQAKQAMMIACLEEIAYKNEWISLEDISVLANQSSNSAYGKYLHKILVKYS
ncbi:glucose-1-phosphate thymidylyltransferase RfbA [Gammaproteobacteria bacterium]|jgi:glucose-1-phosphate thymidylyltransferase|nr:glucose-1-phosphate thymidylyltransferase RfbA [Gammaproteobacteria bacterium]